MEPAVAARRVIDASVACGIVVISQALYCWLKYTGALSIPGSREAPTLFWLSFGFGLVGVPFLALFVKLWKDDSISASLMLTLWEASSQTSISCFEGAEVFYRIKHGWPKPGRRPIVFCSCVAVHSILLSVGIWQLAEYRFEVCRALPIFMHLQYSVMATSATKILNDRMVSSWVPPLEAVIPCCASAIAFGAAWTSHQTAAQCLACILVIYSNGIRGWLEHRDDRDLDELWYLRPKSSSIETYTTARTRIAGLLQRTMSQVSGHMARFMLPLVRLWQSLFVPPTVKAPGPEAGITLRREIEQKTEFIPDNLRQPPSNNDTWRPRFVKKADLNILRPTIEILPTVHVVQEARGPRHAEIAVVESCLKLLSTLDIPLRTESNFPKNQTVPSKREIGVYGVATAKERAERSFMSCATKVILSGEYGRGLDRYYLRYTSDRSVLAKLVWNILLRRIRESNAEDRRHFIQNCVFVGLHVLAETGGTAEFLGRHEESWLQLFSGLPNERASRPVEDPEEEIHLASLLWGLLESAENRGSTLYFLESDSSYSARENLLKLANLMGVGGNPAQSLNFGEIDQDEANRMLSTCTMFDAGEIHVARLTEQISRYVPLGLRGRVRLPAALSHTILDKTASTIWIEMSTTHSLVPKTEAPKDDMLIFLCCCLLSKPVDPAIREWAASPEGHSSYTDLKEGLHNKESGERTILRLLALLSFQMLHPDCPSCIDEQPGLVNVCHFGKFSQHLDDGKLTSKNTLPKMAHSLWRLVGGECCPRTSQLFGMIGAESPKHCLDALSDCYWWYRFVRNCNHRVAWALTWEHIKVDRDNAEIIISQKAGLQMFDRAIPDKRGYEGM